jgi:uridine kinase
MPILKRNISTSEAVDLFRKYRMNDKVQLFSTRLASHVNIYSLGEYEDYYYGYMMNHTGYLKYFKLYPYQGGIVLQMPEAAHPEEVPPFEAEDNLFRTQMLSEEWAERLQISTIGSLNANVIAQESRHTILVAEAQQESRISYIADQIQQNKNIKFVMIAGPSSSGKTTFSQRLMIQLSARGLVPHYVGVDNYFKNRDETPTGPNGEKDFESLSAIDVKGFNEDMMTLLRGEKKEMPVYDFVEGRRTYKGDFIRLEKNDLLVIEGIHCLNDELSYSLPKESKFKIYISALTQLNIDEHNRIPSTDGRLIRRIVRDYRTRGYSASATLSMWNSVRRGEMEHIFPYQEGADLIFNSALLYELSVLKLYAQPLLFQVQEDDPQYYEAKRLLKFLNYFIGVPSDDVPHNSLLREFIGGGCFHL